MSELSAAAAQSLRSGGKESGRGITRTDSRAAARGRKLYVAVSRGYLVRPLHIPTALVFVPNFRAVSAWADTARNLDQHCIVAFDATMHGVQPYEQEIRDI